MMIQPILNDVRPSPIAGRGWYPGDAQLLAQSVGGYLDAKPPAVVPGEVVGLIAPHAGHIYSGKIAADAFRLVRGRSYQRVVVICPMHSPHPDPVLTTGHEAYRTPLGLIPVDRDTLYAIGQHVPITPVRNDPEHALEIELPFLQRALTGTFSLVPLMLRDQSYGMSERLGVAVAQTLEAHGGETLLVASSDLSHFYTDRQARILDQIMLGHIEQFDPKAVIRADDTGEAFACGRAAIATVLVAARQMGANTVTIVGYGTSADAKPDHQEVVGYGAAAITKA